MNAFELAKKNYPKYWSKDRLKNLVKAQKLTKEQYFELTKEVYIP